MLAFGLSVPWTVSVPQNLHDISLLSVASVVGIWKGYVLLDLVLAFPIFVKRC